MILPFVIFSEMTFKKRFLKWAILASFLLFCLFYKQLTLNNCSIKVADDWIRTRVPCYPK